MGDMVETMQALKQYHKVQRDNRAEVNIARIQELNIPAVEQSKNVFRVDGEYGVVMYYPTSNKWQHKGRNYKGGVLEFKAWLLKWGHIQ